jgi:hypothetical protein
MVKRKGGDGSIKIIQEGHKPTLEDIQKEYDELFEKKLVEARYFCPYFGIASLLKPESAKVINKFKWNINYNKKITIWYDTLPNKDILIEPLLTPSHTNRIEPFFDKIQEIYKLKLELDNKPIDDETYEFMRLSNIFDYYSGNPILNRVFRECILIPKVFALQVCNYIKMNAKFQILVNAFLIRNHVEKIIDFAIQNNFTDKYIIQDVRVDCKDKGGHQLKIVISPDKTISFIDPNSQFITEHIDTNVLFYNLTEMYKELEKEDNQIKRSGGKWAFIMPQLDSLSNIQSMLSVNNKRIGACTIVSILIAHIMIYMKISALKAVSLLSTIIVRKFLLRESIVPFADGYTVFLYNLFSYNRSPKEPLSFRPKIRKKLVDFVNVNEMEFSIEYNYNENLWKIAKELTDLKKIGDFMMKYVTKNKASIIRTPLRKIDTISAVKAVAVDDDKKIKLYKNFSVPWNKKKFDLVEKIDAKTPLFSTDTGLMPFEKTVYKITPSLEINKIEKDANRILNTTNKNETIEMLTKEIDAIDVDKDQKRTYKNPNTILRNSIILKIGEILYSNKINEKYIKEKHEFLDFKDEFGMKILLNKLGNKYYKHLLNIRRRLEQKIGDLKKPPKNVF